MVTALHPQVRHLVTTSLHPVDVAQLLELRMETIGAGAAPWRVHMASELVPTFGIAFTAEWLASITLAWTGVPQLDAFVVPRRRSAWAFKALAPKDWVYPGQQNIRGWADVYVRPRARVVIVADDTETPASLRWLLVHEATHVAVNAQGWLPYSLALQRDAEGIPPDYDPSDGETHNRVPEEELCNATATLAVGTDYSRDWWRAHQLMRRAGMGTS